MQKDTLLPLSDRGKTISTDLQNKGIPAWTDSLLTKYIEQTNNELVKTARQQRITEEWLFDQSLTKDSSKYLVFQVGHTLFDKGNKNKRFITDTWLYVDSSKRELYEYDVATDSLTQWKK